MSSILSSSACVDVSSGRPASDASYSNFKATNNSTGTRINACEVTTAGLVAGTAIVDSGAFTTLTVETLTVTGSNSPAEPSFVILPGLAANSNAGTANFDPATNFFTFTAAGDSFTWIVNTPTSATRRLRFYLSSGSLTVTVNGVSLGSYGPGVGTFETASFDWSSGQLTVVFTDVAGLATMVNTPVIL